MATVSKRVRPRYHTQAYQFVFEALRHAQELHGRQCEDEDAHISGRELLEGVRDLATKQWGLLAKSVLSNWGITSTADFGRVVFHLIERGEMRKTEQDQLDDFYDVYDFDAVFDREYEINTTRAFRQK